MKSYLKSANVFAGIIAVFIPVSCSEWNDSGVVEIPCSSVVRYKDFLSEIRNIDELSFEEFESRIVQWQELRDSVFTNLALDTVNIPHSDIRGKCLALHDSIRSEFSRLAMSNPRNYKELLDLKVRLSPYIKDDELRRSSKGLRFFFDNLDSHPICRGGKNQILQAYRSFLSDTMEKGIHNLDDLVMFIEKEDVLFRAFLPYLKDMDGADITQGTKKCCSEVFLAAQRQDITYKDALIYMAMRTNRRLIQNVRACLEDISRERIKTPDQAYAYIWMILQPYASLDAFCVALLSPEDRWALDKMAEEIPVAFSSLCKIVSPERDRVNELPGMLMGIFISSL